MLNITTQWIVSETYHVVVCGYCSVSVCRLSCPKQNLRGTWLVCEGRLTMSRLILGWQPASISRRMGVHFQITYLTLCLLAQY